MILIVNSIITYVLLISCFIAFVFYVLSLLAVCYCVVLYVFCVRLWHLNKDYLLTYLLNYSDTVYKPF